MLIVVFMSGDLFLKFTFSEEEKIDITPDDQPDTPLSPADQSLYDGICANVSACVKSNDSRLFAVVHVAGKQFKVTSEDLISIKTPFIGTQPGDLIRLEKVLLVGGSQFSLVGRPLLPRNLVSVYAMVVEKTLEHPHLWYQFHRRRRHRKMRIFQDNLVTLRIKDISVHNI
nr:unnamed protein product [Spirometra erinaceieuropaei]